MRNFKITLYTAVLIFAMAILGCNKQERYRPAFENQYGSIDVQMTDAPANFTAVNVEVIGMEIQHQDTNGANGGWISLNTNAGIYDLLKLQDSVSVLIANTDSFPVGKINQLRLILGDSNSVEIDSIITFDLKTPSAQQSGLKINVNAEIKSNMKTEILLDFDAEKSIIEKGNSTFSLKPVLKIKGVTYY